MVHTDLFYDTYKHILWFTQTHSMINTRTFCGKHTQRHTQAHSTAHTGTLYMVHTSTRVLFRME